MWLPVARVVFGRVAPSRPCRRMLAILAVWTVVCYGAFKVGLDGTTYHAGGANGGNAAVSSDYGSAAAAAAGRELLQNIVETRKPNSATGGGGGVSQGLSLSGGRLAVESPTTEEALLLLDRSPQQEEKEVMRQVYLQLHNLPQAYLTDERLRRKIPVPKNKTASASKTCGVYPRLYELSISNLYWQAFESSNGTFYLYGAYLDLRRRNRLGPTVRILAMINRLKPEVRTLCHLWFPGEKAPVVAKVLEYKYIWYKKWGNYKQGIFQPYLLACQVPQKYWRVAPASVSIVEDSCQTATNNLRVTYNHLRPGESKKRFAVCVKGLDFPSEDISVRLVEWLELLRALGADKVFLYNLEVHPNVTKVLDYYVKQDLVDLKPHTLPGHLPNMQLLQHLYLKNMLNFKRQNEVIPYNDCLYRNLYRYEYLALLDVDEVIMPTAGDNWSDMMDEVVKAALKVKNDTRASYNFRNVYFLDSMTSQLNSEIPAYLHMLQHVRRSANYTKPGQYVKCFHDPERALILHNHFPLGCLGGVCTSFPVPTDVGHLQHYRADCVRTLKKSCADVYKNVSVVDTTIWRWKDRVIKGSNRALAHLGFFKTTKQQPRPPAEVVP